LLVLQAFSLTAPHGLAGYSAAIVRKKFAAFAGGVRVMAMSERIANEGAGTEAFSSTICRWLRVYESAS
jgi:hypothetical protein